MSRQMTASSIQNAITHVGAPRHQTGLTLVEIMISLTLGLIVLLAVGSVYIGSRQTYRVQEDNARIQEAGKYALEVIGRSLRQAGADQEMTFVALDNSFTCPQHIPALPLEPVCTAISGVDGGAGADTLTVQFYAGREELDDDAAPGGWITRDCTGGQVPSGTLMTNIFNINGTDLRCTGSVGGVQSLVSNVTDLQVVYGINTDGDSFQSADRYLAVAPSVAQQPQVVTARVCVLIRSANDGLTATPQRYLNCAGALGTATGAAAFTTAAAGDLRIYRSFVGTFNLRNRINAAP
jgi:type IV pilus assembly protein PilW